MWPEIRVLIGQQIALVSESKQSSRPGQVLFFKVRRQTCVQATSPGEKASRRVGKQNHNKDFRLLENFVVFKQNIKKKKKEFSYCGTCVLKDKYVPTAFVGSFIFSFALSYIVTKISKSAFCTRQVHFWYFLVALNAYRDC